MDGGEELTAQETALYDRQIRVWGVDAQKRLSKSHILVSGLTGTAVEFCKDVVLAGVGSLTLMDDRLVTEDLLQANFLIPLDGTFYRGRSLADLCCDSLKDFNPMVRVSVEKDNPPYILLVNGNLENYFLELSSLSQTNLPVANTAFKIDGGGDLSQFDGEFYDKFDAVVVSCCSLTTKKTINGKCRKRSKRLAFYAVDSRDSCGEIFVDLQNYTYIQKRSDGANECLLKYPSLEEATSLPWKGLPKKVTKLFFAMRVIERFELSEERNPGSTSISDFPNVLTLRKEMCEAQSLNESHVPVSLLERLVRAGTKEHPPVCAILGGILGQEVIKALSGKGDPLKNFFFFDAADGKGLIEDISVPADS